MNCQEHYVSLTYFYYFLFYCNLSHYLFSLSHLTGFVFAILSSWNAFYQHFLISSHTGILIPYAQNISKWWCSGETGTRSFPGRQTGWTETEIRLLVATTYFILLDFTQCLYVTYTRAKPHINTHLLKIHILVFLRYSLSVILSWRLFIFTTTNTHEN